MYDVTSKIFRLKTEGNFQLPLFAGVFCGLLKELLVRSTI